MAPINVTIVSFGYSTIAGTELLKIEVAAHGNTSGELTIFDLCRRIRDVGAPGMKLSHRDNGVTVHVQQAITEQHDCTQRFEELLPHITPLAETPKIRGGGASHVDDD